MSNRQKKSDIWYDLDNAANIYPAISNDRNTNVFRLSCELREMVEPAALQQALDTAIRGFSYFQVVLHRGMFWFYLERTSHRPVATLESERPCNRLLHIGRRNLLFSVTFYRCRINLEVFHAVADGGGALQLLRSILYHYILIVHRDRFPSPPPLEGQSPPSEQANDSFRYHYDPDKWQIPKQRRAYTISGTLLPGGSIRVICGDMPTEQILRLAKDKGVSVTAYLSALFLCAIYTEQTPTRARKKPIGITIPVDLRNHFPSQSTRNFFSVVDASYTFDGGAADFDAVLFSVSAQLAEKLEPQVLAKRIGYTMGVQRNIFARAAPLGLKNAVLRAAYRQNEHTTTCTLSNMGRITVPDFMEPYIDNFHCLLNPTPAHRVKACVCSFGGRFSVNFTSCIAETKIQKYFFRHLTAQGVDVCITCNGVDVDEIL